MLIPISVLNLLTLSLMSIDSVTLPPKSYKVCVTISTLATSEVTPAMERQAKKRTHRIRPNVPIVEKSTGILKINNACCVDDEEHKRVYH